jgi:ABC-type glycerol-3-phosphate transport system permease component
MIVFALPFLWFAFMALKTQTELAVNPFGLPQNPQWSNLVNAWTKGHYSFYLVNTVIYAGFIVLGVCVLSCLSGYAFARMKFPGRDAIFTIILIGVMLPFLSIMIPMYYLVRDLHILGTRAGLIIPVIATSLPFGTFLMRAFFKGLPEELTDAARIDGCNEFEAFRRVMLPLAWPGLITLVVFEFMWSWNLFLQPLILLQRDNLRPVALALLFFQGRFSADRGMVASGVILTIAPVIILYLILQRKFIEGITAGALK